MSNHPIFAVQHLERTWLCILAPAASSSFGTIAAWEGDIVRYQHEVVYAKWTCNLKKLRPGLVWWQHRERLFEGTLNTTGWPFRLCQTSRWRQNKGCVLVHGPHNKTKLLFWCQREVCHNLNGHPVEGVWPNVVKMEATIYHYCTGIEPISGCKD